MHMDTTRKPTQAASDQMDAIVQRAYGSPEVLAFDRIDRPTAGKGEVLVGVRAAGMDRGTWHVMMGLPYLIRMAFGFRRPRRPVPGLDVAGIVTSIGEGVTRFGVGDEVFGIAMGSFAEYAVAKESKLTHKPANVSFEQAAVASISGLTALQALHQVGAVQPDDRVLVIGASGGVGSYAVQIAAAAGALVDGVASAAKADFVRSLGATEVIDYRTTDVTTLGRTYDLIVDINGLSPVAGLRRILAARGTLVMVGGEQGGRLIGGIQRQLAATVHSLFTKQRLAGFISAERREDIEQIASLLAEGTVTSAIGSTYPLAEARQAMEDLASGRVSGKAAIVVRGA